MPSLHRESNDSLTQGNSHKHWTHKLPKLPKGISTDSKVYGYVYKLKRHVLFSDSFPKVI